MATPLVRATTPTSAGFAQVFDLSGFAERSDRQRLEDKAARKDKQDMLNKTMLDYDPKGLMTNHIPIYEELLTEYQDFMGKNNSELTSPGQHLELQKERQRREHEIKNFVSGSIQMNQDVQRGGNMALTNESYINDANTDAMSVYTGKVTREQYEKGDLFQPVMQNLHRNYMVDEEALVDEVRTGYMSTATTFDAADDANGFNVKSVNERVDRKAYDAWATETYSQQNRDGGDIRDRYKTEDEFKNHILDRVVDQENLSYTQGRKANGDEMSPKEQVAFQPLSSPATYVATPITIADTEAKITNRQRDGKDPMPTRTSTVQYKLRVDNAYAINAEPKGGVSITTQTPTAYNLSTGKTEDIPKAMNNMKVMDVGTYNIANETITIHRKDQADLVIPAGEPIPDRFNEGIDETPEAWEIIKGKTTEAEMARAFVTTNALELMEHMGQEEIMELIEKEGTVNKMVLVPYDGALHEKVTGAYQRATDLDYNAERNAYLLNGKKLTK